MHVLSLPPAFVLSQDQTLMLRIQSLAIITFEIDENFTPSKLVLANLSCASARVPKPPSGNRMARLGSRSSKGQSKGIQAKSKV
nr:hypothetical protein SHINE37_44067 [Rhizobiaceae bacterium]